MDSKVTSDFIFGTLGSEGSRTAHEISRLRGIWHGSRILPLDPEPGDIITFTVTVGTDVSAERVELLRTTDGSFPEIELAEPIPLDHVETQWSTIGWGYVETWQCSVLAEETSLWRYRVRALTPNGETVWADINSLTGDAGVFALSVDQQDNARWLRDAVVYQVFPDRFATTESDAFAPQPTLMDIWGGTLQGITRNLKHIKSLGATAIWLTPVSPSPTHHGYDVTDYTAIEPRLGTLDDFDRMVAEAHSQGLRVILDFVASHASHEHPDFVDALANPDSSHREKFLIQADGSYETFFGVQSMPRINGDTDNALHWLTEAALFWVNRGVDGFRLDYAIGQSMQFWTQFRRALRERNPDVALIAEAVDSPETLRQFQGRLDAVLDFSFLEQIRAYIGCETASAADFWRFYLRHQRWFRDGPVTMNFLDNHDMNRFLWVVAGDTRRLKIAALLQMSLPSPPIIYYGTETGLNQVHDLEYPDGTRRMEESRMPMNWGDAQDRELLEFYRSLVFWRKKFGISALSPRLVHAGNDGLLIFTADAWLIAINRGSDEVGIDLGSYGSMWLTLSTDNGVRLFGSELVLPPYTGAILANERAR